MFIERRFKAEPCGMLAVMTQALNHTIHKLSALQPETSPKLTTFSVNWKALAHKSRRAIEEEEHVKKQPERYKKKPKKPQNRIYCTVSQILRRKNWQRKVSSGFGNVESMWTFKRDEALRNCRAVESEHVKTVCHISRLTFQKAWLQIEDKNQKLKSNLGWSICIFKMEGHEHVQNTGRLKMKT